LHCAHYTVHCRNTVYTASAKMQVSLQSAMQKHSIHYQIRNTMYTSQYTAATQCTLYITMKCVMHTTLHSTMSCVTALLWTGTQCCNIRSWEVRRRRRQLLFQCQWPHQCQETVVHGVTSTLYICSGCCQ